MKNKSVTLSVPQLVSVGLIFAAVTVAWMILGGTMKERHSRTSHKANRSVAVHWGPGHNQPHPTAWFVTDPQRDTRAYLQPAAGRVDVKLSFEPVKKGLTYSRTYLADFNASYEIRNHSDAKQRVFISFTLPSEQSSYTHFSWKLDGEENTELMPELGVINQSILVEAGESVPLEVAYKSRGMNHWKYELGNAQRIRNFLLSMETDFDEIDFPEGSSSPTSRKTTSDGDGWSFAWDYPDVISPQDIGMSMPTLKNPAPIASKISFFAPIPLLFFFAILIIFGILKNISLHPMHFIFLAGCFFSFHLLFAYMVDHMHLHVAFLIASLVSLGLVGSYVNALGGKKLMKIALPAQLIYLVLFSYSFLFSGVTGLTLAVGSIATLALVMHATAKVDWNEVFAKCKKSTPPTPPNDLNTAAPSA